MFKSLIEGKKCRKYEGGKKFSTTLFKDLVSYRTMHIMFEANKKTQPGSVHRFLSSLRLEADDVAALKVQLCSVFSQAQRY